MEGRPPFKFAEWTKTVMAKVKLLPKRFRSIKTEKGNGAPYDLKNKDGHHKQGTNSINSQWGPGPSQNDYPALVSSQYEPVEQSTEQASTSNIVSPISFPYWPYPNTDYSIQGSGNGGDDEIPPEYGVLESDQIQSGHYGPAEPINDYSGVRGGPPHMSNPSRSTSYLEQPVFMLIPLNLEEESGSGNGGDDEIPPEYGVLESDQIQSGHYGPAEPINDYSGVRGGPPHMSNPSRSTSYLEQPVFMLIPLNLEEESGSGNGGDDEIPPEYGVIESDQIQSGHYGPAEPTNDHCGVRGGPPQMSSPSRSTSYLEQSVFMLIPLDLEEASGSVNGGDNEIPPEYGVLESDQIQSGHYAPAEPTNDYSGVRGESPHIILSQSRIHSGEKSYGCGYCGEVFRNKAILKKHILTQQDVVHDICGKASKNLPDLIQQGHSAGMPLFVRCPISNNEFKQKSPLRQHGCVHIETRPYPCVECGKQFRQQSHLTQHLRIHTNEKPFTCIYCGRNFRQRTILNQHLRIHTGEKPYRCVQCGKDFRQKATLDQHTRTH